MLVVFTIVFIYNKLFLILARRGDPLNGVEENLYDIINICQYKKIDKRKMFFTIRGKC
jgi:hypothetical protein